MTQKELAALSDLQFAAMLLQDRLDRLMNPNTPLAAKLRMTLNHLRELDIKETSRPGGYWYIQFFNENGDRLLPEEMEENELDRIGHLVMVGFGAGEISHHERKNHHEKLSGSDYGNASDYRQCQG